MAALTGIASQLANSQTGTSTSFAAASALSNVRGAFQSGSDRARGAFHSVVGERANLLNLRSSSTAVASAPPDGTRCEGCGLAFGVLRRRQTCGACDRFLCAGCLGNPAILAPIACFCSATCPKCREQGKQMSEFDRCRSDMESGVSASMSTPKKVGLFGQGGGMQKVAVWLCLDSEAGAFHWRTLEQKHGRPADEGRLLIYEVLAVRNTGAAVELSVKGQSQATILDFNTAEERSTWSRYMEMAIEVLTPDSERAALEAARSSQRQLEMDERRKANEERKKQLSAGLGMRFTAEAMMNRSDRK